MNEIESLQQLRTGLPPARPESRAAARAGLIARIEQSGRSARPQSRLPWRGRRLRLAAVGVGLTTLLIALPIGILGGDGKVQPAVGQVLSQAAEIAADQKPLAPGPGQFLYTRSKSAYLQATGYNPRCKTRPCDREHPWEATEEWSVLVPKEREAWISFDGSLGGRVRAVYGQPRFVSANQRESWVAAGSPPLPQAGRVEDSAAFGNGFIDASKLPTDPAELRRLIEAREIPGVEGPAGEAETFALVGDMLREAYLPSVIRAAIYELTAELPEVELLGTVQDPVGRPGTGIAYTDRKRGTRHELIFDPSTSALLGERQSIVESGAFGLDAPPGTPIGYAAYLESKVVDSIGPGAPAGAGASNTSVSCHAQASLQGDATIVNDPNPIAACAELWREGVVDTRLRRLEREGKIDPRPHRSSPPLIACAEAGSTVALVFPGPDPSACRRLGLAPLPTEKGLGSNQTSRRSKARRPSGPSSAQSKKRRLTQS